MIEYEFEDLVLEFSPDGSYTKGYLVVIANEADVTFGETIDVTSSKARNTFVRDARELYPEAFSDEIMLKRALNELSVHVTDQERAALAEMEEEEDEVDPEIRVDDGAAEALISEPNVLNRYVEAMAEVHEVYGDRPQMKALALAALSAQLKPLSDGIPAGTNAALMGESGRGKNYLADAIRQGLPDSFVYEFESASAKSLYYEADADPDKFRHTWLYPNEAEGTDNLIEVLRPLLSKGSASHKTVDTGEEGSSTARNLHVEGPVTLTIPTVRNKLDGQLQTRLLVIELEDFENRVAEHSAKVSDTMLLSYAAKDHTSTLALWKAALEKLTEVRRVGITSRPDDFRFRSNKVAHGARLWRNFLSLMLTNAWLEQRNREVIELENGERAVVVDAEDYRVAYEVFAGACVRSGVNISENHRKILNAVYQLQQAEKTSAVRGKGYSYRQIGEKAGCSHEAVRQQKTFLVTSKGFLYEPEQGGLRLVDGAEPSWWENRDFLDGFPRPDQVEKWWGTSDWVDTLDSGIDSGEKPVGKPDQVSTEGVDNPLDTSTRLSNGEVDSKNHVDKPNAGDKGGVSSVSTQSEGERINFDFEYSEDE